MESSLANCCDQETTYSLAGTATKSDTVVKVGNCLYFNRYTLRDVLGTPGRVAGVCD